MTVDELIKLLEPYRGREVTLDTGSDWQHVTPHSVFDDGPEDGVRISADPDEDPDNEEEEEYDRPVVEALSDERVAEMHRELALAKSKHKVFVYGTLRRGEGNNRLLATSVFLGEAVSAGASYTMSRSGSVPFLNDGGDCKVAGELWAVDDKAFKRLDSLEGHPRFYCRKRRWFWTDEHERVCAWVYLCPSKGQPVEPKDKVLTCPTSEELYPPNGRTI